MSETDPLLRSTGRSQERSDPLENSNDRGIAAASNTTQISESLINDASDRVQNHDASLERNFSLFAALGLGFSITNSWIGYLSCFGLNLQYAGPNSVVFGLLLAVIIQWTISVGLYEIASCFPSTGGQYHFAFILAPAKYKRFSAFMVGWMNILGWTVGLCSGISVVVLSVSGLLALWVPTFEASQLQLYIVYLAVLALSACPLFLTPRAIPGIMKFSLMFSIVGFAVVFGLLLVLRQEPQSWTTLLDTHGSSGWNVGVAWTLGLTNSMYPFSATDAAIHIAEEMVAPEKELPRVLNLTLLLGFSTAFPLILAMMLSMSDASVVMSSTLPYGELFYRSTGSKAVATFVIIWVTLALLSACIGQWVTVGRLIWAFARDGGLPCSHFFAHVNQTYGFPVRTTVLTIFFCSVYGLLYLASTVAFNSILGAAVLFSNITYCIPGALVAIRGRKTTLPQHSFDLRSFGTFCNLISPVLVLMIAVFICLPPQLPLTSSNINYTPAVLVLGYMSIWTGWYLIGDNFKGPEIDQNILKNAKTP